MAGSERSKRTGTTGAQLAEGIAINMSISGLGNVISSLVSQADGKKTFIPYRNSKLTHLLCEELGGNCETTFLASISPAAEDMEESISTLRFVTRARKVIQKVVVNDLDVDIAVKKLKAAIVEKETQLSSDVSEDKKSGIEEAIETHQADIRQLEANWLEIESKEKGIPWWSTAVHLRREELETAPYLQNISEDSLLSGITKHSVAQGHILAGKSDSDEVKIQLSGLGIQPLHAILENTGATLSIAPCSTRATVHVNGRLIHAPTELQHLDHVKLGACELFIVVGFPEKRAAGKANDAKHAYEMCLGELAVNHPLGSKFKSAGVGNARAETVNLLLFQEFMHLLPQVAQAGAMAKTFGKDVDFHVELQKHDKTGLNLYIEVYDRKLGMEWLWSKGEFENRKLVMDELYGEFLLNGQSPQLNQSNNPFYDAKNLDICLGRCKVSVHNLAYLMPVDDEIRVFDSRGRPEGYVCIRITPSPSEGEPPQEKTSGLKDPQELIGKDLHMKCAFPGFSDVLWVAGNSQRGIYCKMTGIQEGLTTEKVFGVVSGKFESTFPLTIKSVTQLQLNQFVSRPLMLELWGTHNPSLASPSRPSPASQQPAQSESGKNKDPSLASPSRPSPASQQPAQSESGKNKDPSLTSPSMQSPASQQPTQSGCGEKKDPPSASPSKLSPAPQPARSGSVSGSETCTLL